MLKPDNKIFQAYSYINNGNIEAFKTIIEESPKLLNFNNQNSENLFLYAVKKDKVQFVDYLLQKDNSLISSINRKNENAVMIAAKNIAVNSLDFLLFKRDSTLLLNSLDENNIKGYCFVYKYGEENQVMKVIDVLKKNKIKEDIDQNNQNSLHFLSYNNKINSIENLLKNYPEDFVFEKNIDSELNPIMIAAVNQDLKSFKYFYRNKNEFNSLNYNLLDFSSKNTDHTVFQFLYKKHGDDIRKETIDRVIQDGNDKILNIILSNQNLEQTQIDEITKKANLFPDCVKTILNKQVKFNTSNIFLNTSKEDLKYILKNHTNKVQEDFFQNIQKTLINKKDFINKIMYIFDSIDGQISDKDSLKFLTQIKKIPVNQQIYLLSKNSITNKLSENYKNKVYDLILFRIDNNEPIKNIDTTLLPLYMHGNEKNAVIYEKIHSNTTKKTVFCDLFSKKVKTFEELKSHKYLSTVELRYIKKNLISNQISNKEIDGEKDIPYSILKPAIEKSCIESKPLINENILHQAIEKNIVINFDYWIHVFSTNIEISTDFYKILGKPKKISFLDKFIQNNDKLNESQYINLIQLSNQYEEVSLKLINNIIDNKKLNYLNDIKIKDFSFDTKEQILQSIINYPYNKELGDFLTNNFSIEQLNISFIKNNNLEYLNEFNNKFDKAILKQINFEETDPFSNRAINSILSIYKKIDKKEDINFLTNLILDKGNYFTYNTISNLDENSFKKIDKKTKIKIIQSIFSSNFFSTDNEDNKIISLLMKENDLEINKEILKNYKNLSDDKKIEINFFELNQKIENHQSEIKRKIKI